MQSQSSHKLDIDFLMKQIKKNMDEEFQKKMKRRVTTARNINKIIDQKITIGERLADGVARTGGSWMFIISFMLILILYMALQSILLLNKGFDPYPFILLNLMLSCLAAIQAPVIMMSQNRQVKKDRIQAEEDFETNTRSEVQIQELSAKLDLLIDLYVKIGFAKREEQIINIIKKLEEVDNKLKK